MIVVVPDDHGFADYDNIWFLALSADVALLEGLANTEAKKQVEVQRTANLHFCQEAYRQTLLKLGKYR